MGGQLKENVWKENVAQTLPEGPVEKDYTKQGQQYLDCWVMENGDLLTASKNKSACKLSRKN